MVANDKDFLYYVTSKSGVCQIMEANPRDQYIANHYAIYSFKAEKCLALSISENTFFIMNEEYSVFMLTRSDNNRKLVFEKELNFKEI
jgi:hypothetical protein